MPTVITVTAAAGSDGPGSVSYGFHSGSYGSTSPNPALLSALTITRILTSEVNPSQAYFVVAITGATSQSMFSSVNIQAGSPGTPPGITLNSAAATFVNSAGTGTWTWDTTTTAIIGGAGTYTVTFNVDTPPSIALATPVNDGSIVELSWTPTVGTGADVGTFTGYSITRNGVSIATGLSSSTTTYNDTSITFGVNFTYVVSGTYSLGAFSPVLSNAQTICADVFNCDCESVSTYDTLLNVRKKMMVRLGYPNQMTNPPPGMATLIDQHLRDAQDTIYRQLKRAALRTERFFRWTMVPGQRFYGIDENDNCCAATLDPEKIVWVGFQDLNAAWYRLDNGIPPEYYTRANINFRWPTRYEIRSCIEIFPAPQAAYALWIKGDFGLAPLVVDADRFTIDDKAVYLLALGNMKADRGAKDAQVVLTPAANYVKGLVAGAHGTRRYVPRGAVDNPLTPPKFLPLGNGQA